MLVAGSIKTGFSSTRTDGSRECIHIGAWSWARVGVLAPHCAAGLHRMFTIMNKEGVFTLARAGPHAEKNPPSVMQ